MVHKNIAILGGGNLGSSLARGLITTKVTAPEKITVTNVQKSFLKPLADELGVQTTTSNLEAVKQSEIIVVAVKPHIAPGIFQELIPALDPQKHVLVSVVSGVKISEIKAITGEVPVVRAMPNTAMSVCQSMTAIAYGPGAEQHAEYIKDLFGHLGNAFEVPEAQMPAATVLASCGIAFALRFMRAMATGGIEIGFRSDLSHEVAAQIMKGASELILTSGHHPEREIDKVTTPMGVTISGLNEMDINGLSASVVQGIRAAFHKIQETESSK